MTAPALEIFNCDQNSDEWLICRAGIITASEFHTVKAKGKTPGSPSVTRRKYMLTLVGERIAGPSPFDHYKNGNMDRGHTYEDEARDAYTLITGNDVARVGFIRRGDIGWSPDGLIGDDGGLEIKTKQYDLHLECLLKGEVPTEHISQIQGGLLVSGRQWIDFVSYSCALPLFVKRVHRDERYIAMLRVEIDQFLKEMFETLERVKRMAA